jgi:hypothetical protein
MAMTGPSVFDFFTAFIVIARDASSTLGEAGRGVAV